MKQSTDRFLTTHTGSLPRPASLVGPDGPIPAAQIPDAVRDAVNSVVGRQAAAGIDVVSDGEMGKPGFFSYLTERLSGFDEEDTVAVDPALWDTEFPGFQKWSARRGGFDVSELHPPVCTSPLGWKDRAALDTELANLRAALDSFDVEEAFLPSASVSLIAQRTVNRHYGTQEQYLEALAEVLRVEYEAIVEAGFLLQLDAPELAIDRNFPEYRDRGIDEYRRVVSGWVEALNHALRNIPQDRVRLHVCWGNNEGPHVWDVPLIELVDLVLAIDAGAYCIEASNPRHAHEWNVWETVELPEGKILIPGVIDTSSNYVEHPEAVAQRLERFAGLVGREHVIGGTDCGFGTDANSVIYEPVVWAKLKSLADGAAIASARTWGAKAGLNQSREVY